MREFDENFAKLLKDLGLNILRYRKRKGLTQMALAEKCGGLSRNHMQRIETGKSPCSLEVLCQIARVLEVPPSRLLMREEDTFDNIQ